MSTKSTEKNVSIFTFPIKKPKLLSQWIRFVDRPNWFPSKNSVICMKHFQEKYIFYRSGKRKSLKWHLDPVPTIDANSAHKRSLGPPTPQTCCNSFRVKVNQSDKINNLLLADTITSIKELNSDHCQTVFNITKPKVTYCFTTLYSTEKLAFPLSKKRLRLIVNCAWTYAIMACQLVFLNGL